MKLKDNSIQTKKTKLNVSTNTQNNKNNRLGRGLEALLGPMDKTTDSQTLFLSIEKIHPNKKQPRTAFNKKNLEELSNSIKKNGVLQAILVQKKGDNYQIIAGERRWRAAGLAGLKKIPAIVRNPESYEKALWALTENIQRENLSPIETARAFKEIIDKNNLSQEALAKSLGLARSSVANTLRLLQLDKEVQALLEEKKLSFAQARELLRFKSPKEQRLMAKKCIQKALTVRSLSSKSSKSQAKKPLPFWIKKSLSHLEKRFSQKLKLDYSKGKGRLSFPFNNEEELKSLLDRFWDK